MEVSKRTVKENSPTVENIAKENPDTLFHKKSMKISVIVSTYNQPNWLYKVLWGLEQQSYSDFDLVIADDGSSKETQKVIDWFVNNSHLRISHIWHPDEGFKKCIILNRAIVESKGDYLIFTDGDCIPRRDFVEEHVKNAQKYLFLSGGYLKINPVLSEIITKEDIYNNSVFSSKWLMSKGQRFSYKFLKLCKSKPLSRFLNTITTTKPTWNGHNSSGWKSDILSVNGFNEDMQYGGLDRELGERLVNKGIIGKQIRYSAICIHLDHARPYKSNEILIKNNQIRKNVRKHKLVWTDNGIIKQKVNL